MACDRYPLDVSRETHEFFPRAGLECLSPKVIDEGPNKNRTSIAFPAERNSGMDSGDVPIRSCS
jgi:hypothetical protein